jgi:uncharacterized repeat protein (TIGR01451 family)
MGKVGSYRRLALGGAVVTALTAIALVASSLAGAAKVEPELISGASNQGKDCSDNVGPGQSWVQLKVDPNADGVYSDGTLQVTVSNTQDDKTFDWSSNLGVDAVIVKGGADGSYIYRYDPPSEQTSDTGLTTPGTNGISHINFCYDADVARKGTLTVVKKVVNDDGGSGKSGDWTMNVSGPTPLTFPGAGDPGTTNSVDAGSYTVSESSGPDGYTLAYSGDCDANGNVTVPVGQSKTCVLTNDDKATTLTVVKSVVNDNGGTAVSSAFTMTINGVTAAGGNSFPGAASPGVTKSITSFGSYSVSESSVVGYRKASASADCEGTIALGQHKTCTIVNDDAGPKLTIVKHVVNDNGGTGAPSAWTLDASGPTGFSGAGPSVSSGAGFAAGSYDLSEAGPAGYAASAWVCSKGQVDGDTVSVGLGDDITCTITNDDRAPKLKLVKQVVNDNGGTQTPSAWNLAAAGPTGFSGAGPSVSSSAGFDAGSYDLSESGPSGYDASAWVCSKGQVDGDTVSVGLADDVTCTIVNNDKPATLIVKKVVVNDDGGTAKVQDFSFQVNGGAAQAFEADGQNDLGVTPGTYAVVEPAVAGYTTTYEGCSNIVIQIGGTATCTVTNNDVPRGQGSISISKSANPTSVKEPGGQVTFSVTITNTSADVVVTVDNVVDDKFGDLDDDGGSGCFDVPINLVPGGKVNCTFSQTIMGAGGTSHVNVVTVTAHDATGHSLTASDDARVDITPRLIDLVIAKDASSPTPLNGIVDYSLKVTNKGPDTATDVQLADPAPAGITYLTASPSQGTCNVSAALVTCSLGSIAPGQTVTIAVTGRAIVVGTLTNTATVAGSGGRETNPADNVDSAVTVVSAPLRPPVVKPKPKPRPKPEVCVSLVVSPKMITADGKPDDVKAIVSAGGKPMKGAKVGISGAGVAKTARTNGKGVAVIRINPRKPGIITATVVEAHRSACGAKRIGVVGVFLPPLTG